MNLPVVYHDEVMGEVEQAYGWYEAVSRELGEEFL